MRVLWLSGNPSLYSERTKGYYSGGWIGAMEAELTKHAGIELGIAFFYDDNCFKRKIDKTVYYPINLYNTKIKKIKHNLFLERYDLEEINVLLKVVNDFEPDIIHVWGTEISFGLIAQHTKIPVLIHLQGLLNPIFNSYFIPNVGRKDFVMLNGKGIFRFLQNKQALRFWEHCTKREIEIIRNCKYFLGRTEWDKSIIQLLAPLSSYYHCNEMLRLPFYNAEKWKIQNKKRLIISSVISSPMYKGVDVILKTANILNGNAKLVFEWNVYGITDCQFAEKLTGINAENVHVDLKGVVSANQLIENLQNSDIFVHTSYIDNSPNSICEAQMIGLPVITTNVGGISSLVTDNKTGILVPSNDPYLLASRIIYLTNNTNIAIELSNNALKVAKNRHDKDRLIDNLLNIYSEIIKI